MFGLVLLLRKMSSPFLIFTTMFLAAELVIFCLAKEANATSGCISRERNALLKFKASLSDPSYRLSSWNTSIDCCYWQGVICDRITGHVIGLDLPNERYDDLYNSSANMLQSDTLDSSILDLKHLRFLDLSGNDFQSISIPEFLGSINQLRHLNLSYANFSGVVPPHLGNLSRLTVLDINGDDNYNKLIVDDFMWVSRLTSLMHLDMSGVDLSSTQDLLSKLNMLQHVVVLSLSWCGLESQNLQHDFVDSTGMKYLDLSNNFSHLESLSLTSNALSGDISKIFLNLSSCCNHKLESIDLDGNGFYGRLPDSFGRFKKLQNLRIRNNLISGPIPASLWNLSSLKALDLAHNQLTSSISPFIGRLSSLEYLDLATNQLSSSIPSAIGNLTALEYLGLFQNQLSGPIPSSIGNSSSLKILHASHNKLDGEIPVTLGQLSNLEEIYLSDNYFNGTISEAHFATLSKLKHLELQNNSLRVEVRSDWTPPFQLKEIHMRACEIVGHQFPHWLKTQHELQYMDLSNCSISGVLPRWLHYTNITYLHLSHNHFVGSLPDTICEMKSLWYLGLLDNRLSGSLPDCFANLTMLSHLMLSINSFTGVIPNSIGGAYSLQRLQLSNNTFTGEFPATLGNCTQLRLVDLSMNSLSGPLPDIWANLEMLSVLIFSSNQLSGAIPGSIGGAYSLEWLQLNDNKFSGVLPFNLRNCTLLNALDVGENSISGELPRWIGTNLLNLEVLRLRSNRFNGAIPSELCQLQKMYLLDFADNKLTGEIPRCFGNFSYMISYSADQMFVDRNNMLVVIKGIVMAYFYTLQYVLNMDLSSNDLVGEIPLELTRLAALHFLNLSHNHLQGGIPGRIGEMKSLESLDLSNNNLFGNIPGSLSNLTSLSHLNLSRNNLTGGIPTGRQLQTLEDPSIYEGNPGLCGAPLPKNCGEDNGASNVAEGEEDEDEDEDEDRVDKILFSGVIISGFATGFWGAIGVLVLKMSWRRVYFKFTDGIIGRILRT